jgi:hypothetical protein
MLPELRLPWQRRRPGAGGARAAALALPAAAVFLLATALPHAQTNPEPGADFLTGSSPHAKFNRQLTVFERVLDDVLVDSENALVTHDRNANGAYLPGHGAVFAFDFSLVGRSWGHALALGDGDVRFFHSLPGDGDVDFFEFEDDDDDDDDDKDRDNDKDREEKERERRRAKARIDRFGRHGRWSELDDDELKKHRTRQYGKVKLELIDTLGEYGDILEGLPADEWVTLVARPRDLPWGERKIKRLVIRARMRDITERVEDRIDEAAFRKRLVIEEYK